MRCRNCGAPHQGGTSCSYCGAFYGDQTQVTQVPRPAPLVPVARRTIPARPLRDPLPRAFVPLGDPGWVRF